MTSTKTDAGAIDHKVLSDVAHSVKIPVVAIGGINKDNISQLEGLGLDGVAVVSAIFAADDISSAVIDLKAKAEKAAESSVNKKGPDIMKKILTIAGSDCRQRRCGNTG